MTTPALPAICNAMARALAPRKAMTASEWADAHFVLSAKGSSEPGEWRTRRNPPLREPMDCLSARSPVRDVALMFPIQFGKTQVARIALGYGMDHDPGPMMVCLPGEVSMKKWVAQQLNPLIEEVEPVRRALTSTASRDSANQATFKDFAGGQLYIEHAGSPQRLKSTSVRRLIVDELDEFAGALRTGDDPVDMLNGRTSGFQSNYKRLYISTPGIKGASRIDDMFQAGDQRRYYVPCPHCGHAQPLEWSGLMWDEHATSCWYVCRECGCMIAEHHKTDMIAAGHWHPENPGARTRSYTINGLYYAMGLGPRWLDLVHMWLSAQNDPARLKTFLNDRLAEPWEDPTMRAIKQGALADRAEPYPLRHAPEGVLAITAGIDTQDDRLEAHIVGWGPGPGRTLRAWTLDYVRLPGDPAEDEVWDNLTDLLNKPIEHASGALLRVEAMANDGGGHRTEDVKNYVRQRRVNRPMVIFGSKVKNAPVLSRGKLEDVNWRGKQDKRGVTIYHVGTVNAKDWLYGRLAADADKDPDDRAVHFPEDLRDPDQADRDFFAGMVSEVKNPRTGRYEKRRGPARNEPLDTWVYAFAAAHNPNLRLHRLTKADWETRRKRIQEAAAKRNGDTPTDDTPPDSKPPKRGPRQPAPRKRGGFATNW